MKFRKRTYTVEAQFWVHPSDKRHVAVEGVMLFKDLPQDALTPTVIDAEESCQFLHGWLYNGKAWQLVYSESWVFAMPDGKLSAMPNNIFAQVFDECDGATWDETVNLAKQAAVKLNRVLNIAINPGDPITAQQVHDRIVAAMVEPQMKLILPGGDQ